MSQTNGWIPDDDACRCKVGTGGPVEDRLPPQSLEAEEGVIGSALIDPNLLPRLRAVLDPEDFYLDAHGALWNCLCRLSDRGEPIDCLTFSERLTRDGTFERAGGRDKIERLMATPSAANGEYYAGIVRDLAEKRRVIDVAYGLLAEGYDMRHSGAELARIAQARIERLACGAHIDDFVEPPPWPAPIGRSAYLGVVGDFVDAMAPHTEADPAALLLTFLTFAGNLIGPRVYTILDGSRHRMNLFLCLVGESANSRKGTSAARTRQALERDFPSYLYDQISHGLASGEGLINAVRDEVRDPQGKVRAEGVEDKRLLLVEEEFSSVLDAGNRDGSTLLAKLRMAWDSSDLHHKTRREPLKAIGAHISLIGHITAYELDAKLKATAKFNGFANRVLWCCVREGPLLPFGSDPPLGWQRPIGAALIAARAWAEDSRHDQPHVLDADARELWGSVYPGLRKARPGTFGAVTSRATAYCRRLGLLYAMLDPEGPSILVRPRHIEAALEVWRYCDESARYLFSGQETDPDSEQIVRALTEAGGSLTRTQISVRAFRNNRSKALVETALARLIRAGRIRRVLIPTAGRAAESWELSGLGGRD